jgi:hypothetical protein
MEHDMSYDIWLTIDTGGPEPATVADVGNMTSNVAPMWRLAGADLADFDGKTAGDCLDALRTAVGDMAAHPAKYEALNPPNGWGDQTGCLRYLMDVLATFELHPLATVVVSR